MEQTGRNKPGKSRGLRGTGPGSARQDAAGPVFERFWNRDEKCFRSEPGPVANTNHDDIMKHCRTLAEHIVHNREVPFLQTKHGLNVERATCAWACQKVDFRSFDSDMDGIHPQEHKTHVVMDWLQPENCKEVRCFLCLSSYYKKFIQHYAQIAMVL